MFISRKLATGRGPLGTHPHRQGPRQEALSSAAISKARFKKKKKLFSLREVAGIRSRDAGSPSRNAQTKRTFSLSESPLLPWGSPVWGPWVQHSPGPGWGRGRALPPSPELLAGGGGAAALPARVETEGGYTVPSTFSL